MESGNKNWQQITNAPSAQYAVLAWYTTILLTVAAELDNQMAI